MYHQSDTHCEGRSTVLTTSEQFVAKAIVENQPALELRLNGEIDHSVNPDDQGLWKFDLGVKTKSVTASADTT